MADELTEAEKKAKADRNDDGMLTEKEVRKYNEKNPTDPLRDPFTVEEARAEYGYTVAVIDSDPKLQEIFAQAVREEWSGDRFKVAVKNWARDAGYGTASALSAYKLEKEGGDPWDRKLEQARDQIRAKSLELGIDQDKLGLDTEAGLELTRQWVYGGYNDRGGEAIIEFLSPGGVEGTSGVIADSLENLRSLALANGVQVSDGWLQQATDSLARGATDLNFWQQDIREQAAQRFPSLSEKIKAGVNVQELASPYMSAMQRILERGDVSVDDPWISQALGDMNPDGTPKTMTLYEFETALRKSSEWQNTTNGKNTLLNTGTRFLRDMGFVSDSAGLVV